MTSFLQSITNPLRIFQLVRGKLIHKSFGGTAMKPVLRFLTLFVVLAISFGVLSAQEVRPQTGAGSKAVLFEFSGLSNLGVAPFHGGVGLKYYLASMMALRGSIGVGYYSKTTKGDPGYTDEKESTTDVPIGAGLEYHVLNAKNVSMYLGGELGVGLSSASTSQSVPVGNPERTTSGSTTTIGIGAILGVEYFISQSMSISGEYRLAFSTSSGSVEQKSGGVSVKRDLPTETHLGTGTATLTVAIYF